MLHAMQPRARGEAARRAMFLAEDLWTEIQTPGDDEWEERMGHLLADLDVFITGEPIHPKYLFLLYPPRTGVWEIRSVRPDPSLRLLGLFAAHDVFIATTLARREDLGGWQSRDWKTVKRAALAAWRRVLPNYGPLISSNVNDLVSGAIDGRYVK